MTKKAASKKIKKEKDIIPVKPVKEFLKYVFSDDEIHAKGQELARLNSEKLAIKKEKKSVMSLYTAKLDKNAEEIDMVSEHINNGYEDRYIDCEIHFNDPNSGMKTIYRKDDGSSIRTLSMSPDELQLELALIVKQQEDPGEEVE